MLATMRISVSLCRSYFSPYSWSFPFAILVYAAVMETFFRGFPRGKYNFYFQKEILVLGLEINRTLEQSQKIFYIQGTKINTEVYINF